MEYLQSFDRKRREKQPEKLYTLGISPIQIGTYLNIHINITPRKNERGYLMYPNFNPYPPASSYIQEDMHDPYRPYYEQRIYEPYEGQIITAPANTRFWRRGTEVFLHSSAIDPSGREMLYIVYPIRRQNNVCSLRAVAISANEYRGMQRHGF